MLVLDSRSSHPGNPSPDYRRSRQQSTRSPSPVGMDTVPLEIMERKVGTDFSLQYPNFPLQDLYFSLFYLKITVK